MIPRASPSFRWASAIPAPCKAAATSCPRRAAPRPGTRLCFSHLTKVRLTLLVGRLAQERYLPDPRGSMSEAVASWRDYLPEYVPLPHPSWRTLGWARKNPWFEGEMLPDLRARIAGILK